MAPMLLPKIEPGLKQILMHSISDVSYENKIVDYPSKPWYD